VWARGGRELVCPPAHAGFVSDVEPKDANGPLGAIAQQVLRRRRCRAARGGDDEAGARFFGGVGEACDESAADAACAAGHDHGLIGLFGSGGEEGRSERRAGELGRTGDRSARSLACFRACQVSTTHPSGKHRCCVDEGMKGRKNDEASRGGRESARRSLVGAALASARVRRSGARAPAIGEAHSFFARSHCATPRMHWLTTLETTTSITAYPFSRLGDHKLTRSPPPNSFAAFRADASSPSLHARARSAAPSAQPPPAPCLVLVPRSITLISLSLRVALPGGETRRRRGRCRSGGGARRRREQEAMMEQQHQQEEQEEQEHPRSRCG